MASISTTEASTPGVQPAAVEAEDATQKTEGEEYPNTAMFVSEVASLINHEDIQSILATQAEMYVVPNFHTKLYF